MGKYEQTRGMTPGETEELERAYNQVLEPTTPAQPGSTAAASQTSAKAQKPAAKVPLMEKLFKNLNEKQRKMVLIGGCAAILLILIIIVVCIVVSMNSNKDDGRIFSNVYAGGVNLGGMTEDEAKSALHLATDSTFSRKDMVIRLPDDSIVLSPEDTGASLNVDAVVAAAYSYGRDGQTATDEAYTIALLPYLNLDLTYIQGAIADFCDSYSSTMTQPTVELKGDRPEFDPENPDRHVEHQLLVITMGTPDYILSTDALYNAVLDAYSLNQLSVTYEAPARTEPEVPDAQELYDQYCAPPQDATVDEATFEVTPEVYGYGFDVEELKQRIDQAEYGQVIELELDFLVPRVTEKDLAGELFLDVLAQFTAINSDGNSADRNANLRLVCAALNGYVLNDGEEFSFNSVVGRLTAEKGYKNAPAYVDGTLVNTLGGGVSQTASALYYCALQANLDITERHNHTYAVTFVPLGFDANVEYGSEDLRFRNNTGNPLKIVASASDGTVVIELVGTDNLSYKIELESEIITTLTPETIHQTMAKDNVLGYKDGDVLVEPITGYVVNTSMKRLDKVTGVVLSTKSIDLSHYSKRDQQVVAIEPDPTQPTEPLPTEPTAPEVTVPPTDTTDATDPTTTEAPEITDTAPDQTQEPDVDVPVETSAED